MLTFGLYEARLIRYGLLARHNSIWIGLQSVSENSISKLSPEGTAENG